jgi:hypothetical protein
MMILKGSSEYAARRRGGRLTVAGRAERSARSKGITDEWAPTHPSAFEIASGMLKRQQADVIIAAPKKIVLGAVGMRSEDALK